MRSALEGLMSVALTVFFAVSLIFLALRLAPGDPVERVLGPMVAEEEAAKLREQLGLNLPLGTQYKSYLMGVLRGDLGDSLFKKQKVFDLIKSYFSPSLLLAFVSVSLSSLWGIALGVLSAVNHGRPLDRMIRTFSLLGLALPIFSLAPILIYLFAIHLGIFPVSEWGEGKHVFLPVLTLMIPLSTIVMRVTRTRYLEDLKGPWVQVLRSKGLSQLSVLLRVLKSTLPTVLNVVAIQLSVVWAGTVITETIFDIPGMGSLLFEGLQNRDYPLVQGIIVYMVIIYLFIYFSIDFINGKLDPRMSE